MYLVRILTKEHILRPSYQVAILLMTDMVKWRFI